MRTMVSVLTMSLKGDVEFKNLDLFCRIWQNLLSSTRPLYYLIEKAHLYRESLNILQ